MIKEQSNSKDMKQQKEGLLTKNKTKKMADQRNDSSIDVHDQIATLLQTFGDHDIFVCFKDKKTKQFRLFSTDPSVLSLDQIKISKKTENLLKFELTELVSRLKRLPKAEEDTKLQRSKDNSQSKSQNAKESVNE